MAATAASPFFAGHNGDQTTGHAQAQTPLITEKESHMPNLGFNKLYDLQLVFEDRFKYPNNVKEAESINSTIVVKGVSRARTIAPS